ncbi:hypothetical protein ACFOOL_06960 [Devosia honganensis]|uniref:Regulatory protein GemA n=1 Tax=Devosia honganensis TaxID=1610527 RepID=A0ABV7X117_9HYPH
MARRGPKPKQGAREANGRLSRKKPDIMKRLVGMHDKAEREAMRPGIEARHRHYGLDPRIGKDQMAGSFVGRLAMSGEITQQQYEAAVRYCEVYQEMQATVGGPKPSGAVNLNATRGMPAPENVERSKKALADWRAAVAVVQERQNEVRAGGALIAALDYCVLRDESHTHMVGWMREGLNALARHFKIGDKRKAA